MILRKLESKQELDQATNSKESCDTLLAYFDYLRKSQCTKTITWQNRFGETSLAPNSKEGCQKALDIMEDISLSCIKKHVLSK